MSKLTLITLLVFFNLPALAEDNLQLDFQGDAHYSRYNFTDIKKPYNGIDGFSELKFAYWLDKSKSLSPYLFAIPTFTSESEFWWQKNVQIGFGLQFHPFINPKVAKHFGSVNYLRSIRFYALGAWKYYYDKPEAVEPEDTDIQIGVDYYYDSLFDRDSNALEIVAWTNGGFRQTNFLLDDYNAFLWMGNVKMGREIARNSESILLPYAVVDWTYAPKYEEQWWDNKLLLGAGIRWYLSRNSQRRFYIYGEYLHNAAWLGDKPGGSVEGADFRVGFGFSTGGFFKVPNK